MPSRQIFLTCPACFAEAKTPQLAYLNSGNFFSASWVAPGNLTLVPLSFENEALKRDSYHTPADVEKTPDLKHREKGFVFSNDDVLDRPDFLVLVVDDAAADQLARAIALGDLMHVNDDELDLLRQYGPRERRTSIAETSAAA
jgi:hypothetical protein